MRDIDLLKKKIMLCSLLSTQNIWPVKCSILPVPSVSFQVSGRVEADLLYPRHTSSSLRGRPGLLVIQPFQYKWRKGGEQNT